MKRTGKQYVSAFQSRYYHIFQEYPAKGDTALCGWKRPEACFIFPHKGGCPGSVCVNCAATEKATAPRGGE